MSYSILDCLSVAQMIAKYNFTSSTVLYWLDQASTTAKVRPKARHFDVGAYVFVAVPSNGFIWGKSVYMRLQGRLGKITYIYPHSAWPYSVEVDGISYAFHRGELQLL